MTLGSTLPIDGAVALDRRSFTVTAASDGIGVSYARRGVLPSTAGGR